MPFLLIIGPILLILVALASSFSLMRRKVQGFWDYFVLGWALQILLSLPAGIWQGLMGWPHIAVSGVPLWGRFVTPLVGWPFNAGGSTVRAVFEITVVHLEWLVGRRTTVVSNNMLYYAFLLLIQGSILAAFFARRYQTKQTYKDPLVVCMAVLFLANSLLNVTWFWAGT